MDVKDKVAVITGASKGIGRQTALTLAQAGAHVAIAARDAKLLGNVAGQVKQTGRDAMVFPGDMSVEEEIQDFLKKTIAYFGKIDILVNNAGVGYFAPVAELSTRHWDEMFAVNVRAVFILTREALPYLRQAGEAVIVNVISISGKHAFAGGSGYGATKHALLGFTRSLMFEERRNGLRVLALCPGSVETEFFANPLTRHMAPEPDSALQPEDIADTILHMIRLPYRATISEIDIRPSNPKARA